MASGARDAMGSWVAGLHPWSWFVTHTYDHEKVARRRLAARGIAPTARTVAEDSARPLAADVAWRHLKHFVGAVGRERGSVRLFSAMEPQKNGWPHFHSLIGFADNERGDEVRIMHGAWFAEHGYIKIERPRGGAELAAFYATKLAGYTVKQLNDGRGWYMSRELRHVVKGGTR